MGEYAAVEDMERLKIVITGATGFIGSNLVLHFERLGHDVYPIGRKGSNPWRLAHAQKEKKIVYLDLQERENAFSTMKKIKPDVVIHTAAYGVYGSQKDREKIYNVNLMGTMNLLDACIDSKVHSFINTGTVSEYGNSDKPMVETDRLRPETDYAISKALATKYCMFRGNAGTKVLTLRLFSPYGYYEDAARLVPYVLASGMRGDKMRMSSPSNVRDFVFIEDVAAAYSSSIVNMDKVESGDVINIGFGKQSSVGDVVKIVEKTLGKKLDINWGESGGRPGDNFRMWQADITKAQKVIGWRPITSLESGITKTAAWIKENIRLYEGGESKG